MPYGQGARVKVRTDIKSMTSGELAAEFEKMGEPRYRAGQVFKWLSEGARSFDAMTDIPKGLRARLDELYGISRPRLLRAQTAQRDGTAKYLWEFEDGNCAESVAMRYSHGETACISCQAGCRMGCAFCATAAGGLARDLTASEMLDQVVLGGAERGVRATNIVLMGMGEPLDNFDNVLRFLRIVGDAGGANIGMRRISLSTCGLTEKVDKLSEYNLQLTLSISLHAPDDETRSRLMPVNTVTGVDRLFDSARRYFSATGRRVSYEYALIDRINDYPSQARSLARKVNKAGGHLNLITLNRVPGGQFLPSGRERVRAFEDALRAARVNYTFRRKLGGDIDAACGQLRGAARGQA
ncbi:MAG: 23S rRNA (adenine(2503)-C(2))-methyltransferase RlmN [Oscillospiraceae bacterium]|jgi:23S rRNA (adenine2503-C2)-methyltransferase|nr:23S rRNA (adenine(2503)-C(2))-methyltransferase RlmN [Oscillospiraceae bacterium]